MAFSTTARNGFGALFLFLFAFSYARVGMGETGMIYDVLGIWQDAQGWEKMSPRRALLTMDDNVGSFYQCADEGLLPYYRKNRAFSGYVNPEHFTQALVYRQLRFELPGLMVICAIAFLVAVFLVTIAVIRDRQAARQTQAVQQANPHAPWLRKPEWRSGVIRSGGKVKTIGLFVFAVFWNLFSTPVCFFIPQEISKGNTAVLLSLIFPLIGVIMLYAAIYHAVRWLRYGETELHLTTLPGVLGGRLEGSLRMKTVILPEKEVCARLDCLRRITSGSGKNRSTRENILWQKESVIPKNALEQSGRGTVIPIAFHVPFDQPASDDSDINNQVVWRLVVHAKTSGVDYGADFTVPVFQTADSDSTMTTELLSRYAPTITTDDAGMATTVYVSEDPVQTGDSLRRAGILLKPGPGGGLLIRFPMLRQPGLAFGMLLFACIWGGVVAALFYFGAPLLFRVVFALFLIPMVYMSLEILLGASCIEINRMGIQVQRGLLGIGPKRLVLFDQVQQLNLKQTMQAGNTLYYTVVLEKSDGKKLPLAGRLKQEEGRAVIQALENAITDYRAL